MKKYKELVKENIKKYEELIKYCTAKNRAFPINWYKIMELIEIDKLRKRHRHHYYSLILGSWHYHSVKAKIERFHKQIKYGIFWSHNPKVYENLKKYLMNLKRDMEKIGKLLCIKLQHPLQWVHLKIQMQGVR